VRWDDSAPMTPLGQMVFFAQFLHAGGRWEDFCKEVPFGFTSPNAQVARTYWVRWHWIMNPVGGVAGSPNNEIISF